MNEKMNRKEERELALRGIFQIDFHEENGELGESITSFLENAGDGDPEDEVHGESNGYAKEAIDAAVEHHKEIDDMISHYLKEDWDFSRIPKTEKAILRLGITELLYIGIPKEIAIDQALELAKRYGSDESKTYINGILNNVAVDHFEELSKD
ncbi:MAG: transcription antitermination factor NusB [Eubacterium sp.]